MSYWSNVQIVLERVFSNATGIPFIWEDEPRYITPRPFGLLGLGQSITIGRDYSGYTFKNSDITLDICGQRELTIHIQIFSRQAKGEQSSRELIEKARLSLANPVYRDELRTAGLIFVENHPVADLDFSFANRKESRAAFDVVFRLMLHNSQTCRSNGYFSSVELSENIS